MIYNSANLSNYNGYYFNYYVNSFYVYFIKKIPFNNKINEDKEKNNDFINNMYYNDV